MIHEANPYNEDRCIHGKHYNDVCEPCKRAAARINGGVRLLEDGTFVRADRPARVAAFAALPDLKTVAPVRHDRFWVRPFSPLESFALGVAVGFIIATGVTLICVLH